MSESHRPSPAEADRVVRAARLARVLPLWPRELYDTSLGGRRHIVRRIARALREERCRGRAGHWAYDLARHAALSKALSDECRALAVLEALICAENAKNGS